MNDFVEAMVKEIIAELQIELGEEQKNKLRKLLKETYEAGGISTR